MDPDFLTSLTSMFGPKPGVDPFALGGQLATDPTQAIPALAQGGPPPAKGQSITDWVQSKMPSFASNLASAAGSQPAPSGIPTGDVTGASAQPPMPRGGWIPPNPAMKAVPKSISPTAPSPLLAPQRPDLSAGAPQPDAPYLNLPGLPSRNPMTADANVEPQAAPPGGTPGADFVPAGVNQRRSVPDIQAPLTNTPPAAAAPTAKVDPAKLAAVLKSLGGTLAGVKALLRQKRKGFLLLDFLIRAQCLEVRCRASSPRSEVYSRKLRRPCALAMRFMRAGAEYIRSHCEKS
jgi:hypothetical protein